MIAWAACPPAAAIFASSSRVLSTIALMSRAESGMHGTSSGRPWAVSTRRDLAVVRRLDAQLAAGGVDGVGQRLEAGDEPSRTVRLLARWRAPDRERDREAPVMISPVPPAARAA